MNVYFGKMNNAEQCRNLICSGGNGVTYFGGMQPGDLAFIRLRNENPPEGGRGTHIHRLWRLLSIDNNPGSKSLAHFEEVFEFNSIKCGDIMRLNLFKLDSNSVVFTMRTSKGVGFYQLELTDQTLFQNVTSFNNYIANPDNYRNVVFVDNPDETAKSDRDIQIFKNSDGLYKIFNSEKPFVVAMADEFESDRYNQMTSLLREHPDLKRKKGNQQRAYKWLNSSGQGPVSIANIWDLFCSKQKLEIIIKDDEPEDDDEIDDSEIEDAISDVADAKRPLNIILYGPPGTGKTRASIIKSVAIVEDKSDIDVAREDYGDVVNRFKDYINDKKIGFITFHQSYSYEDFIEGIKPVFSANDLLYEIKAGVFKDFCNQNVEGNRCFIIDEINRGNVSKIFGELITLIEPSKRKGEKEAIPCKLPYSKEEFLVPNNIYLIGTMNTADRSLVQLDAALRRRFSFEEIMPNYPLLADIKVDGIEISKMLKAINDRITVLLDREHQIGHSYFLSLKDNPTMAELKRIFRDEIIPLLQEYFYEDYSLIKKVLNDENDFVVEEASLYTKNFDDSQVAIYRIPSLKEFPNNKDVYLNIYTDVSEIEGNDQQEE